MLVFKVIKMKDYFFRCKYHIVIYRLVTKNNLQSVLLLFSKIDHNQILLIFSELYSIFLINQSNIFIKKL